MSTLEELLRAVFPAAPEKSFAAWPVWAESSEKPVEFTPMPKKAAVKLWHRARDFDRQTRKKGGHGGALGPSALQVLHALIFDFLNFQTGRLDPSQKAIARQANLCPRAVSDALKRLKGKRCGVGTLRRVSPLWWALGHGHHIDIPSGSHRSP
jgi:hypothetical protein